MGNPNACPDWSDGQDALLRQYWETKTRADIAAMLGRTTRAVVVRARKLGLAAADSLDRQQWAAERAGGALHSIVGLLMRRGRPMAQSNIENSLGRRLGSLGAAIEQGLASGDLIATSQGITCPGAGDAPVWVPLPWEKPACPVRGARVVRFGPG